ncbi:hypothetical protein ADK70_12720 [Streptomyces rimosus subsp. pseudoverticillatus]|uniref:phosphoadenosine phosphosulfate reductase domain-containing protein n=1 Tax=Streptomyces rimosus TaxID=1927 RepID=UPI0006B261D4|nr:phosphoadenosine phosphosulfate reductase family protein [Streptomyces rimosus]KOT94527.1 hypothetical protein ADK70_12720 [Streptomyces rimosus subsp. pseudoverticillatus]
MRSKARDGGGMLPGMPDGLEKKPPKASDSEAWKARTLAEAEQRTFELLDQVIVQYSSGDAITESSSGRVQNHGPRELAGLFGLYSGGNDSVVLTHMLRRYLADRPLFRHHFKGMVHVNTGIAIPQTTQHVREVAAKWSTTLLELHPRVTYLDLILGNVRSTRPPNVGRSVWRGFPGPGGGGQPHNVMYMRLKDQPLQALRKQYVGAEGARKKVLYVAGMRWDESDKRFRNAEEIGPKGGIVWVSALVHWTNAHMREYRARWRCHQVHRHEPHRMCFEQALPLNEVTANLHMSGDCTCGCYAKPNELDEIGFFYPEVAARIRRDQEAVRAAGIAAWKWGTPPPAGFNPQPSGPEEIVPAPACAKCVGDGLIQGSLEDDWLAAGLITEQQHRTLRAGWEEAS